MFGEHVNGSPEMGKVITDWHCDRIEKLIKTSGGEIVTGGRVDRDIKYVEATVIVDPKSNSDLMNEEIFGPVLPIVSFSDINSVINHINSKDKPLAVYYFGKLLSNVNLGRLMEETSSG
jgi:acyl-CoA reductase-like NAD-dependent aldehyde dehydrogenase